MPTARRRSGAATGMGTTRRHGGLATANVDWLFVAAATAAAATSSPRAASAPPAVSAALLRSAVAIWACALRGHRGCRLHGLTASAAADRDEAAPTPR